MSQQQIRQYNSGQMSLNQQLLVQTPNLDMYNPYQNPPNLKRAQQHRKATKVGLRIQVNENENINEEMDADTNMNVNEKFKQCICCGNVIEKNQISLYCDEDDLLFLGVGYPIFFRLFRYFGIIIIAIFIVSGSGFYLLTTLSCQQKCVYFLQVPILNPSQPRSSYTIIFDITHFLISILILLLSLFLRKRLQNEIYRLQQKQISPQDYTIIVQNLPEQITEQQIIQWSKQKFNIKPIVVNFVYNLSELEDAFQQRLMCTLRVNRLQIKKRDIDNQQTTKSLIDQQLRQLTQKIQKHDKTIQHYKHENITNRKIGTVFLTFQQQKTCYQILQKYETNFFSTLLNNSLSSFHNKSLKYNNVPLVIRKAPAPREIIWENLSFSYTRYIVTELLAVVTMVFVLFLAFKVQVLFAEMQYEVGEGDLEEEAGVVEVLESISMAVIIMTVNLVLRFVIQMFVNFKKHYSHSRYQSSFCLYYSLMYIFNTCFMIYIIHINNRTPNPPPKVSPSSKSNRILLYDIHFLLLINSLSDPLYKLLNPYMWSRFLRRKYISSLPPQQNPYTQAYINQLWQQHSISNVDNYQYIFRVLVVTIWFVYVAPLGVIISIFGYVFDYWLSKYVLLRWAKMPENVSKRIAVPMIKFMPMLALVYLCGVIQYVYKVSDSYNLFGFIFGFLRYSIVLLILLAVVASYYFLQPPPKQHPNPQPYTDIQQSFQYSYHTQNPMTKLKSQIKLYSYHSIKHSTIKNSEKMFNEFMQLSSVNKNSEVYSERQSEMNNMKRRKLKKLQTMEIQLKNHKNKWKNKQRSSFQHSSDQSSSSIGGN